MARQAINIGTSANDGTGDTLRAAGEKINDNFGEIYHKLGGDSDALSNQISLSVGDIIFEGATTDDYETSLNVADPTADRTVVIPNASGTLVLEDMAQILTNKTLTSPVITTPQINDTSANHQYVFAVSELTADRTVTLPLLTGNDEFVFKAHTQTLTNKTLTSPTMTAPKITNHILDNNGAESIIFTSTASAVNEITIANGASGGSPTITASGTDTNIDLELNGKGTGGVSVNKLSNDTVTMTANGTASTSAGFIVLNKATAISVTLGNGSKAGEVKWFACSGAGDATITPSNFAGGSSVTIQQGEAAEFVWSGSTWFLVSSYNGTLNP